MIIINTISPYIDIDDHDDNEYEYADNENAKSMMMNICSMMMMMNVMMLETCGDDADNHVDWTFDDNDGAYITWFVLFYIPLI